MSNIENQICEAIELIVNKSINEARYDKTIQATVLEQDSVTGKYKCRYQDSIIYAYTTSNEKVYQKDTLVYILVPENDMSNAKTILGSVENLGSDYVSVVEENQRYETIGNDVVLYGDSNFNLSSYSEYGTGTNPKILYQKNLGGNLVSINNTFKDYLASTDTFGLAVTIQTNLPKEQQQQGNYGIIVGLDFKDEQSDLDGVDSNTVVTRYYILDIDSMKGNPYRLTKATKQKIYFNIDTASFIEVNSIAVFAKDFPHQNNSAPVDISFSQIELTAERKLTQEEIDGCSLTFVTSKGTIFGEDSDLSSTLPVEVAVRARGENVDASKLSFYWFKEDSAVNERHSKYNYIGGKGWYCLNQYNLVSTVDGTNQVEWIAASYKYDILYNDVKSKTATYKCAVIYNDNVYFKTLNIENRAWSFDISIESSNGVEFYSDAGTSTLTCKVVGVNGEPSEGLTYSWSIEKASGAIVLLPEGNINEVYCGTPAGNVLPNVQIKNIEDYSIFKCSVHSDDIYLGTATIQLKNIKNAAFNLYNLILRGGKEVYKYDIYGTAPTSVLNETPMVISPLDFSLLTPNGDELDLNVLDVEWVVPKTNTMLIYSGQQENSENYKSDSDYHYIKNVRNLPYTILSNYNESYKNNTISLIVKYKGLIFTKDTEFVFLKEGELGTNGTQYICKIYPNTEEYLDSYPIFMVDSYAAPQGRFNFDFPSIADDPSTITDESLNNRTNVVGNSFTAQAPFIVKIFKNNEEIYNSKTNHSNTATDGSTIELKWEFLRNTYAAGRRDITDFEVNEIGCLKWCGNTLSEADRTDAPANILKCTATIFGSRDADKNYSFKKFTVSNVVPIVRAIKETNEEIYVRILKDGGFQTVEYGIDGNVPRYNKSKPFEVALYDGSGVDITLDETWNWSTRKQIYNVNSREINDTNSNEVIASYKNNELTNSYQWYGEPALQYNGLTVTNTIVCSNSRVQLSFPVYLYLAKNTIAEINGWDGNTLTVNEEGGFIMSPKVGVGEKDNEGNFTGLFMGGFQDGVHDEINGMLGFHRGEKTIFLDAKTGKAEFGKAGHQIIVDPSEGKAEINGNYDADAGTGMKIDFENPSIRYGNGKFEVNEAGELTSTAGQIGGYNIGKKDLQGSMVGMSSIPENKVVDGITQRDLKDIAFWAGSNDRKTAPFRVAFDGSVDATKLKITSNNFSDSLKQELDDTYLSTDFKVDEDSIVARAKKETVTELGGRNLIVLNTITEENKGGRLSSTFNTTAYLYAQEGYMTTEPISVEVGEDYYISSRSAVCGYVAVGYFKAGDIYSERPVMINASFVVGQKITIPEGVLYCRVSFNEGDKYNIKFEKGSVATPYSMSTDDINNLETRVASAELKITDESIISTVQETVNTAKQEAINSSNSHTDDLLKNYASTKELESQIKQESGLIGLAVAGKYTTKEEFKALEVGGRNLVLNTSNEWKEFNCDRYYTLLDSSNDFYGLDVDDVYTYRVKVKSGNIRGYVATIQFYTDNNNRTSILGSEIQTDSEGYVTLTSRLTAEQKSYSRMELRLQALPNTIETTSTDLYCELKLERGGLPTDWSPAPEDTRSQLTKLSERVSDAELKITDDAIKATVESQTNTLISSALEDYSTTEEVESMLTMDDSGVAIHYQKKIDKAISNISVGGRNLVINSAIMDNKFGQDGDFRGAKVIEDDEDALSKKHLKVTCTTAGPGFYCSVFPKTANKIGKTYIWSFEAKCSAERTGRVGHECGGILPDVTMSTNWKKYSYSWKFTDEVHQAVVFYLNFKQGDIFYLRDFKIEEGNVATAWTEAPEDAASRENERLQDFNTFIETTYTNDLAEIQKQIDKSITTWFSEGEPTLQKAPAAEWTTPEMKAQHLGDLYYDNETGYCYRFTLNGSTYSWVKITDTDVTKALQDAAKAQDTADGKRRVFVDTPVTPYDIGDLWAQGSTGDLMKCKTPREKGVNFNANDWEKASKYTDDSAAEEVRDELEALEFSGVNRFVKSTITEEKYLDSAGTEVSNTAWGFSDYIDVEGWKHYIASGFTNLGLSPSTCFYDVNKQFISGVRSEIQDSKRKTLEIPSNAVYMRFSFMLTDLETLKIEQGQKATGYSPSPEDTLGYADNLAADLKKQVDSKIQTYNQPSTQIPSSSWSADEKKAHEGDLWYVSDLNTIKRWNKIEWVELENVDSTARGLAESKAQIFVGQPKGPYCRGDLWMTSGSATEKGIIKTCIKDNAALNGFDASHWIDNLDYADSSEVASVIQEEFDKVVVGGRNLWLNGDFSRNNNEGEVTFTGAEIVTLDRNNPTGFGKALHLKNLSSRVSCNRFNYDSTELIGKALTFQCWLKYDNITQGSNDWNVLNIGKMALVYTLADGTKTSTSYNSMITSVKGSADWTLLSGSIQLRDDVIAVNLGNLWIGLESAATGEAWVTGIKLEYGNVKTDWSPAPEDTESYADDLVAELQEQVDNKIESHSTSSDPSTAWTTTELKKKHKGDLWYNPTNKETKRWDLIDGAYKWSLQTDGALETLAQSKAQIFSSRPTKGRYNVGDLWIDSKSAKTAVVRMCVTARAEGVAGSASDWVENLKYTDDTIANGVKNDLAQNYRKTVDIAADIQNGETGIGMAFNKKVSEIKIGARNLLVNTNRGKQNWLWATDLTTYIVDEEDYYGIKILKATSPGSASNLDLQFTQFSPSYSFIEGQEYCLGFDIYLETTGKQIEVELQSLVNSNFISNFSLSNGGNIQKGVWTSVEGSLKLDFTPDDASQLILNIKGLSASANVIKIANLRLEYGNKISDWTPAPEEGLDVEADYQKRIAAVESSINANETGLLAKVSDVEILINGDGTEENPGINEEIAKLKKDVALQITPTQLSIEVSKQLEGLDSVDTKMGFKFDSNGLNLSKSGAATNTQLDEDGMRIRDSSGNEMLTANHEGVDAYNLHATTYLIIGSATRFEDYGSGRTGCFPQSGNE